MITNTDLPIIATWPRTDDLEPEGMRVFTGNEYADWAETNHLTDAMAWPANMYGLTSDGTLTKLNHTVTMGDFGEDDYASIVHAWTTPDGEDYATGIGRRDGRA